MPFAPGPGLKFYAFIGVELNLSPFSDAFFVFNATPLGVSLPNPSPPFNATPLGVGTGPTNTYS